jgi:hypothetical protein
MSEWPTGASNQSRAISLSVGGKPPVVKASSPKTLGHRLLVAELEVAR